MPNCCPFSSITRTSRQRISSLMRKSALLIAVHLQNRICNKNENAGGTKSTRANRCIQPCRARSRKVRSGWLLLCYSNIVAQSSCNVKYAADFFKPRLCKLLRMHPRNQIKYQTCHTGRKQQRDSASLFLLGEPGQNKNYYRDQICLCQIYRQLLLIPEGQ